MLSSERRTAAVRRTGRPRGRGVPRGRWPSPARPQTARRAAISSACCVRRAADDGQAAHGRPGQQRRIRPLAASLASSCPISSPGRVAGEQRPRESPTRCRLGAARRSAACYQAAAVRPTPMSPPERTAAFGNAHARGRATWPLAQAAHRAVSGGRGARKCIGTLSHPAFSARLARGARAAGRRGECGRASLGRAHLDTPLGRRSTGVARRGARRLPACRPPIGARASAAPPCALRPEPLRARACT